MTDYLKRYKGNWLIIAVISLAALAFIFKKTAGNTVNNAMTNAEVQKIVKDYILNNPDVIIQSLEEMQKRKIQEMKTKVQSLIQGKQPDLENSAHSPFFGNDKGDIVIVVFYDDNCGYCKKANVILNELVASDSGVKVILKPLPILGESSEYAAKVSLAVFNSRPDKFKAFHDDMMNLKAITKENIIDLCDKHQLEYSSIEDEMEKPEIKAEIQKIRDLAMEIEINGAPAFIINGEPYSGLLELSRLRDIIKNIRSKPKL